MWRLAQLTSTHLVAGIACCLLVAPVHAQLRPVSLQLLWNHQFQFAGYYAAEAQGFYAEEGLAVQFLDGGYSDYGEAVNPVEEVVFGRADFGITRSDLLLERMLGLPVIALAAIYQRSPFVLVTTAQSGIRRLEDIGDKPVMLSLPETEHEQRRVDTETLAMLKQAGIDYRRLNNTKPSWNYEDLRTGKTTLMAGYATDTPWLVRRTGAEPLMIYPQDYGIDFYGDVLFTSEHLLSSDPEVVARFRRASMKGWRYALAHPAEVISLIMAKYYPSAGADRRQLLAHEAQKTIELMQPDVIEVGYMSRERWRRIEDVFVGLGIAAGKVDLDKFLYNPGKFRLWQQYRMLIFGGAAAIAVILAVMIFVLYLNRQLRRQIFQRSQLELSLKAANRRLLQLSDSDALTGLHNRRFIDRTLEHAIKHAERYGDPLAIALIDIDHFKGINDSYGHAAGDRVLVAVARQISVCVREADFSGRYGGEEFLLVFPSSTVPAAGIVLERLRSNVESLVVEGAPGQVTISAGLATLTQGESMSQLVSRADKLLYLAKQGGRNRVVISKEAVAEETAIGA